MKKIILLLISTTILIMNLGFNQVNATTVADLNKDAQALADDGKYIDAINVYSKVLEYDSDNEDALIGSMRCYCDGSMDQKNISFFETREKTILKLKNKTEALDYYYNSLYWEGLYYDAIKFHEDKDPDSDNRYLGAIYIKIGEYDKALEILGKGYDKEKAKKIYMRDKNLLRDYEAYMLSARILKDPAATDEIVSEAETEFRDKTPIPYGLFCSDCFEKCCEYSELNGFSESSEYDNLCGLCDINAAESDLAMYKYKEAVAKYSAVAEQYNFSYYNNLVAEIYLDNLNDYEKAYKLAKKSNQEDDDITNLIRAKALFKMNDVEKAKKILEKSIKGGICSFNYYLLLEKINGYKGIEEIKNDVADSYIALPEDDKHFLILLYNSEYKDMYADDLIKYADYILSDIGNDAEVLRIKAQLMIDLGYYDDALKCCETLKSNLKYSDNRVDKMIAKIYMYTGDFDRAVEEYDSYIEKYPWDYEMKLEKANLIIEADNNYKDALKYAQDILTDYGNIPEASRLMLYCMYKLGQFDEIISSPYSDSDAVGKAYKAIAMKELGKDGYEDALPKVDEEEYVTKWDKSYIYALIGQNDKCLSDLKGVVDSKEKDVNYIRTCYIFDGLHSDGEFKKLLKVSYPPKTLKKKYTTYMMIAIVGAASALILVIIIGIFKVASRKVALKKYKAKHEEE